MNAAKSTVLVFALGLFLVLSAAPADDQKIDKADDAARNVQQADQNRRQIEDIVDGWGFPVGVAFGIGCPGDTDASGDVGVTDLLEVLATWGPCPGCPADFDGSGVVDISDLLTVLAFWGPC